MEPMKKRVSLVNSVMWALLLTHHLSLTSPVTGSAVVIHGEVGGNVTFHCQSDKQKTLYMISLQIEEPKKEPISVNGYYRSKPYTRTPTKYQQRSQVDHIKRTIVMWYLNISDSTTYKCHTMYDDPKEPGPETTITLVVKPKPTLTTLTLTTGADCYDGSGCVVTCAVNGGYPEPQVTWNVTTSDQRWKLNNSTSSHGPSMLFNVTSTASVNCTSGGPPLSLRCSVGDVTSNWTTVCNGSRVIVPPDNKPWMIPAAVGVLAVIIAVSLLSILIRRKCKTPCPDHETGPTHSGEDMALNRMDQPAETEES